MEPSDLAARIDSRSVLPGDVLLLSSNELAIKIYQCVKRLRLTPFTHVAVALGGDLVVDAIPREGVRLCQWSSIQNEYRIERCRVARHETLAADPDAMSKIWGRAMYYHGQPYRLQAMGRPTRQLADEAGLVCSHFVALVFSDIGIGISRKDIFETLPLDIDVGTQTLAGWQRLSFNECQIRRANADVTSSVDITHLLRSGDLDGVRRYSSERLAFDESIRRLQETIAKVAICNAHDTHELTRLLRTLDGFVLTFGKAVLNTPNVAGLMTITEAGPPPDGAKLLALWAMHFEGKEANVPSLSLKSIADNRGAHQKVFVEEMQLYLGGANANFEYLQTLRAAISIIPNARAAGVLTVKQVDAVREFCKCILSTGSRLFPPEPEGDIQARSEGYLARLKAFGEFARAQRLGPSEVELASEGLKKLRDLDVHRLQWVKGYRAILEAQIQHLDLVAAEIESLPEKRTQQ